MEVRESTPSINVQNYNDLNAPSQPHLIDTGEHTEVPSSVEDEIEMAQDSRPAASKLGGEVSQSGGDPHYILSLRSRKTPDAESDAASGTETIVQRRNLTVLDVAALIFNKMVTAIKFHFFQRTRLIPSLQVGTGIFTTPGAVLSYTRSKPVSLALWAVGGVWTILL